MKANYPLPLILTLVLTFAFTVNTMPLIAGDDAHGCPKATMAEKEFFESLDATEELFCRKGLYFLAESPEVIIYDQVGNLIAQGDLEDEWIIEIVHRSDFLTYATGTLMYMIPYDTGLQAKN